MGEQLDYFSKIITSVVSLSLCFGIAVVLGKCLAIGFSVFGFLTISDIAVNSLIASPAFFLEVAVLAVYRLAYPRRASSQSTVKLSPRAVKIFGALLAVFFVIAYLFFPPRAFVAIPFFTVIMLTILAMEAVHGRVTRAATMLTAACCIFMLILTAAYLMTSISMQKPLKQPEKGQFEFCTDVCAPGRLVARFSEISVVRWVGDNKISIIPNTEIKKLSDISSRSELAILEVRSVAAWFRGFWH